MRFTQLLFAAGKGLLKQIPIMGSVLGEILAERERSRLEVQLADLLKRLSQERAEPVGAERILVTALHLAQAEVSNQLQKTARPNKRFLYLAAKHYAGPERTFEIAAQHGFLWRSYYKKTGAAVGKVDRIAEGDVIALGYRVKGNKFRLLLPLVVTSGNTATRPIDTAQFAGRNYGPFVWASNKLAEILSLDYRIDPIFNEFTGLAVQPLFTDVTAEALAGTYDSPGTDALWEHDYETERARVPHEVRDWIAGLGVSKAARLDREA